MAATGAVAQDLPPQLNMFGTPGLIEMPNALSMPDGELSFSVAGFGRATRATLSFQVLPWARLGLRYGHVPHFRVSRGGAFNRELDRSLDLHLRLVREHGPWPEVALGFRDFLGSGRLSSEYLVATRHVTPRLRASVGLGWGRMASHGGFSNPLGVLHSGFQTRPRPQRGGGQVNLQQFFRGDAALFGGVEYQATDRLTLVAEYSSDAYPVRQGRDFDTFGWSSPFNFGLRYRASENLDLGAAWVYGSRVGVQANFTFNPTRRTPSMNFGTAPVPVAVRPTADAAPEAWGRSWALDPAAPGTLMSALTPAFAAQGLELRSLRLTASAAEVRFSNRRHDAVPQAVGRAARVLSAGLPPSVEDLVLIPVVEGLDTAAIRIARTDLERLEHGAGAEAAMLAAARITDAASLPPLEGALVVEAQRPRLGWSIAPYLMLSTFDPDNPIRADIGLRFNARYDIMPNLVASGSIRKRAVGNLASAGRTSTSVLPRVRSDFARYDRKGDPALDHLTLEHFARPGPDLYSRLTVGYLERMFAGVSAELLWKPVDSRLALGVEVNHARQRAFDQRFGLRDYSVATGHASVYYDLGGGYLARVDAGRYLAGDWGATIAMDREFANGWRIGAFATFTNVSAADFGEGAFDKGLRVQIPLGYLVGNQTRTRHANTIRPIQRDGGARLDVRNRLYDTVRPYHAQDLEISWSRFWQ